MFDNNTLQRFDVERVKSALKFQCNVDSHRQRDLFVVDDDMRVRWRRVTCWSSNGDGEDENFWVVPQIHLVDSILSADAL